MIESYHILQNDIKDFENAIRYLSMGVNNAGISWSDEQYQQLAGIMNVIAASSRGVLQAGINCENSMKKFDRIVEEI